MPARPAVSTIDADAFNAFEAEGWERQAADGRRVALTAWDTPERARFLGVILDAVAAAAVSVKLAVGQKVTGATGRPPRAIRRA
jgi:hypothetical protein